MNVLSLSYIAKILNLPNANPDIRIKGVNADTRKIVPGDLFVALPGERVDGHDYIQEATAKGAVAVLASRKLETHLPCLIVPNTLQALGILAKHYRAQFSIPLLALTGSCGKTTVKEMIAGILAVKGSVLATLGNQNTEVGVPLTLLRLLPEHSAAVVEMGARHKNDIAYLMSITNPSISLITNAGVAHIEIFGSEQGIAQAKGEIFEGLSPEGTVIINRDDANAEYWLGLLKPTQRLITFGFQEKAEIRAINVQIGSQDSRFELITDIGSIFIKLSTVGEHNIQNALAAAAGARAMGVSLADIQAGLENFRSVTGRLQFKAGSLGAVIIDDTYNANPASMRAALAVLAKLPGKKIFVMGDMFELGSDALDAHRQMGIEAKQLGINTFLGIGELTRAASESFGENAAHYSDKASLIDALSVLSVEGATILIKGSRGMRMEEVVAALCVKHPVNK